MFSINDKKSERFTMPTRARSLAVARRATLCALAAVGVAACGVDAPEPDGSSDPTALSPGRATRDDGSIEKALFGPNDFASADNCLGEQQDAVRAAEDLANVLMGRAQDALAEVYIANDLGTRFTGSDPSFEGRFGPLNETTWSEVYDRYTGISQAMPSNVYSCHVDGDLVGVSASGTRFVCGSATVKAVTNGDSTAVRLCPDFFSASDVDRAGTLIHETSHQDRTYQNFGGVGTDDLNDAVPFNAYRLEGFAMGFDCDAGAPRCPTVF